MDIEQSWSDLTADEKLKQRFQIYTSPRLPFVSPEAEAGLQGEGDQAEGCHPSGEDAGPRPGMHAQPVLPGRPGRVQPL